MSEPEIQDAIDILHNGGAVTVKADGPFEIRSKLSFTVAWYAIFRDGKMVRNYFRLTDSALYDWLAHLETA